VRSTCIDCPQHVSSLCPSRTPAAVCRLQFATAADGDSGRGVIAGKKHRWKHTDAEYMGIAQTLFFTGCFAFSPSSGLVLRSRFPD